jgi:hypothetical protein
MQEFSDYLSTYSFKKLQSIRRNDTQWCLLNKATSVFWIMEEMRMKAKRDRMEGEMRMKA